MKYYLSLVEIADVLNRAKKGYIDKFKSPKTRPHEKKFAFHAKIVIDKIEKDMLDKANKKINE